MRVCLGSDDPRVLLCLVTKMFQAVVHVLVEGPLKHIAVHIIKTPGIGFLLAR